MEESGLRNGNQEPGIWMSQLVRNASTDCDFEASFALANLELLNRPR